MTWEISSRDQLITVGFSLLAGVLLAVIYDLFKAPRLCRNKGSVRIFFEDVFFGALSSLICFCLFMLRTKGQIRLFYLACCGAGFLLWRISLSKYFLKVLCFAIRHITRCIAKLKEKFYKIFDFVAIKLKKFWKKGKKGLKGVKRLLYNQLRKFLSAGRPNEDTTG